MLIFFQKFIFKKFVLQIGDNGAHLTFFKKGTPVQSVKVSGIKDEKISELTNLLRKYPRVPVYLLTDVSEQSFKQVKIPSTNPIIIKKLLGRRLARDYKKEDLHNYFNFKDKDDTDKSSSNFIVTNIAHIPPLSDWLDYTKNIPNPVDAVYSIPIELSHLVNLVEQNLKTKGSAVTTSRWKMLILQSDLGGFRIIVTKDSQLIFSRLLNFDSEKFDREEIETLRNQILGTIEFLRRIGYKDKHGINGYLLFKSELSTKFDPSSIKGYNVKNVDSDKLANIVYGKKLPTKRVDSIDQDVAGFFVRKGKFLGFLTKNLEQISMLNNINLGLTLTSMFAIFFLILFILFNSQSVNSAKSNIDKFKFKKNKLSSRLETIREEKFGFDIDEDKVIDVAKLHNMLNDKANDPLEIVVKLSGIIPNKVKVKNFSWDINDNNKITLKVSAVFSGEDLSYEELFSKYDVFIRDLKTEFNKYEVQHSDLPDTINFGNELDDIPITLNITGPNA